MQLNVNNIFLAGNSPYLLRRRGCRLTCSTEYHQYMKLTWKLYDSKIGSVIHLTKGN